MTYTSILEPEWQEKRAGDMSDASQSPGKLFFISSIYFTNKLLYLDTNSHCHSTFKPQQRPKKGSRQIRCISIPGKLFFFISFLLFILLTSYLDAYSQCHGILEPQW